MPGDRPAGNATGRVLALNRERHATLEHQERAGRQHRQARDTVDEDVAADPFGLDLGQIHPIGDLIEFIRRQDRQLALVAHFGTAWIPRLARAGRPRHALVTIAGDAGEGQLKRVNRRGREIAVRGGKETGDPA